MNEKARGFPEPAANPQLHKYGASDAPPPYSEWQPKAFPPNQPYSGGHAAPQPAQQLHSAPQWYPTNAQRFQPTITQPRAQVHIPAVVRQRNDAPACCRKSLLSPSL